MSSNDPVDTDLREMAAETAQEVAIQSEKIAEEIQKEPRNPDGDPCNSYEWSLIFLLILVLAYLAMGVHLYTLWKRWRAGTSWSCFDVLTIALFACIVVQFYPMLSQVLHSGHGVSHFSQSGCKLLFYTDYGMRHVVTFLVCAFLAWAYLVLFHNFDPENLDGKMRGNVAWLIITLFAIEGIFGVAAAVYVDVGPKGINSCVWTNTMDLTLAQIVALEMVMRPITPYLLPMLLLAYPLVKTTRHMRNMEENRVKSTVFTCLVLTWSYFAMNLCYAILLVTESANTLAGSPRSSNWVTVCNFKWAFFLLHQSWFLLAPCAFVALEVEKGNKPVGSDIAISAFHTARQKIGTRLG